MFRHRRPVGNRVFWDVTLIGAPVAAGAAVDALLGWWPGLVAFLVVAFLVGRAAYRADRARR